MTCAEVAGRGVVRVLTSPDDGVTFIRRHWREMT